MADLDTDTPTPEAAGVLRLLRRLRQSRRFTDRPVDDTAVHALLEVARWTGSAKNTQPWHFVVVRDRDTLAALAELGPFVGHVRHVQVAIMMVFDGASPTEFYDEGRVSERLMLAASALGLGSGTAWWGSPENSSAAKALVGVPDDKRMVSCVYLGYADDSKGHHRLDGGRKPLSTLVSGERYGQEWPPATAE